MDFDVDVPIVFFDGVCHLCDAFVSLCVRATRGGAPVFRYAPLQGPTAARLLPPGARDPGSVIVLTERRMVLTESDAVLHILSRLRPRPLRLLASFVRPVPRPLRDAAYRLVARNRHRLFGTRGPCRVPLPSERDLFLP